MNTITGQLIRVDSIDVPVEYERRSSLVEDDALRRSIESSGVQQPIVVVSKGNDRYGLIDGSRRVEIAKHLNLHTIPAVIDELPSDADPKEYQDRLRFILDEHRQDLFPSQRAALINRLKKNFGMVNKDVALYLGIDAGSIRNWVSIEKYAPAIVKAIDTGEITAFHARGFDGLKPEAQGKVWRAMRNKITSLPGAQVHKLIRAKYNPKSHSELYLEPEKTIEKLARKSIRRKARKRKPMSRDEKEVLAKDLDLKEVELTEGKEELMRLKREITQATQPIRGIMRSKVLVAMLADDVKAEFERFYESYC